MLALIQRVTEARVVVDELTVGEINQGLMILCGFQPHDDDALLDKMLHRCLHYRVFSDGKGKMNLNVQDIDGGLLLVPQFTLAADTKKGLRPSFSSAAVPQEGQRLFELLRNKAQSAYHHVAFGQFGANMQVHLCNNGPVTFMLEF